MQNQRKYLFDWDNTVGADMKLARPALGPDTKVEVYRLFQFTLRDILEQHYGSDMADNLFREAGIMAGKAFFEKFLNKANDVSSLAAEIQASFNKLGIGIFRVENAAEDNSHFIFTVGEDLDCSGLPDTSDVVYVYDESFIAFNSMVSIFSLSLFKLKEKEETLTDINNKLRKEVEHMERLRAHLSESPVSLIKGPVEIHASFGFTAIEAEKSTGKRYVQKLIHDADTALYAAKLAGRNRVVLFNPEMESGNSAAFNFN
jgi:hypothetical protein